MGRASRKSKEVIYFKVLKILSTYIEIKVVYTIITF